MKKIYFLIILANSYSCTFQSNPKIKFKDYSSEFKADGYPKSIIDLYKREEKLTNLTDREIAIKINADIILEELLDNILRYNFLQNAPNLKEGDLDNIQSRLTNYYETVEIDFYNEKTIIDRAHQWIADSIVQSKYGGRIYYDSLKNIPKPKEAYSRMIIDLLDKQEIEVSDEFLRKEILSEANNYTKESALRYAFFLKLEGIEE